jgi:predicted protein tyrosine phosphatase
MTSNSNRCEFVNFREVFTAEIASKRLYRSSHPAILSETDFIMAKLAEEAQIASVLNLVDNEMELAIKADRVPWYHCLFKRGCIIALDMGFDCLSDWFSVKLKIGFKFMLEHSAPYLIHCFQGIDRTGFMIMLLEMLMGADKDEMVNDYMMSFLCQAGFENGSERYQNEKNNFCRVLQKIYNIGKISKADDFAKSAKNYLLQKIGLTLDEINLLKLTLSK